jgi:hypothetical protein
MSKGPYMRSNLRKNIPFFFESEKKYMCPSFSKESGKQYIKEILQRNSSGEETDEIDVPREVLQDLGYID